MSDTRELARGARQVLSTPLGDRDIYRLDSLADLGAIDSLPYTIKILLESCLRNYDDHVVTRQHLEALASYDAGNVAEVEIPFTPSTVVTMDPMRKWCRSTGSVSTV